MQNNCPKCGGLFIPNFINGELVSQCCSCGYIYNSEDNEDIIKLSSEKAFKNKFNNTKKSIVEKKDKLIVISYLKYIREKRDIADS